MKNAQLGERWRRKGRGRNVCLWQKKRRMNTVIQFMHPGDEHSIKSGTTWNNGAHKRKYLNIDGDYLTDLASRPQNERLYFWGEWEAQSKAMPINSTEPDFPSIIFSPYYSSTNAANICNTDPFAFGDSFYYCVCKQGHYSSLRDLNKGDIILFGSCKHDQFVLDTLFVVKGFYEYELEEIPTLKSKYNKTFYDVSLAPLHTAKCVSAATIINKDGICTPLNCNEEEERFPSKEVKKYRIYEAAMYEDRYEFDGLFSYVPCLPNTKGVEGFKRPNITKVDFITNTLTQGIKITPNADALTIWKEVTKQVLEQGLNLLIKTDLPTKK